MQHGTGHAVSQSSVGAELRSGAGEIDGLARAEEGLDATGAPVLHLRCGYVTTTLLVDVDDLRAGVLRTTFPSTTRSVGRPTRRRRRRRGPPARSDRTGRQAQAVHGPADLTGTEVAQIVESEQPRTVLTTTPGSPAAWAHEHLRPLLTS